MNEPTHKHRCTLPLIGGFPCGRMIGPYFAKAYLVEALARHLRAQHANTLPAMKHEEPGDARIRGASNEDTTERIGREREERYRRHQRTYS